MHVLRIIGGPQRGKKFTLRKGSYTVGREKNAQIQLESPMVSRLHSSLEVTDTEVVIIDHGSSNGTVVNGTKVNRVKLKNKDKIYIGNFILEYSTEEFQPEMLHDDTFSHKKKRRGTFKGPINKVSRASSQLSWSVKLLIVLSVFLLGSGFLLLSLVNSKIDSDLDKLALSKGKELVKYLAEKNKTDLAKKNEMLLDVESVLADKWVKEAYIVDRNGLILAPLQMQNQISQDPYVLEALNAETSRIIVSPKGYRGQYALAHPIRVLTKKGDKYVTIGAAKILFSPNDLIAILPSRGKIPYTFLLPIILIIAIMFVLIRKSTLDPIKVLAEKTEQARIQGVFESEEMAPEFIDLIQSINRLSTTLQTFKTREEQNTPSFNSQEKLAPIVSNERIDCIISAIPEAALVFDNEKIILSINDQGLDFFNITGSSPIGKKITELVVDKKIINAIDDAIEDASESTESIVSKTLDLGLKTYQFSVAGLKGHTGKIEFGTLIIETI